MGIPMTAVASSNIEAIGHDPVSGQMHVRFKNGGHYVYDGVDADTHAAVIGAKSVGSALAKTVIGSFDHRKIDPNPKASP